ncbi:MAG: sigma-70 family RNA polymerase sigma factor [Clostridia bacterium]|nr:sigma-70 family RNA polymerase sigma factor [Clostridia bacterium]
MLMFLAMIDDPVQQNTFQWIYETYQDMMRKYACSLMHCCSEDADDVLQECFMNIARNMDTVGALEPKAVRSYVMQTVKRAVWRQTERERREDAVRQRMEEVYDRSATDAVLEEVCTRENYRLLVEVIRRLPEGVRDVLELHYLCRMELRDIARQFGISYNAVKKRYQRGKRLLAAGLREGGVYYGE